MPTRDNEGLGDQARDAGTPENRAPVTAEPRPQIFVSYTPADEDWASWISWELESVGYQVTLQAWDFIPGTNFVELMDRGVADATVVIAVLSQSYLSSRFGRLEWQAALLANPDNPSAKLVTVRVRECSLEGLLSTITYVDLAVPLDEQQARRLLRERVGHTIAGRAKPDTGPPFPSGARPAPAFPPAQGQPATAREPEAGPLRNRRRPLVRPVYPPDREQAEPSPDGVAVLHVPGPRFGRERSGPDVPATAGELQARLWADVNRMLDAGAPRPDLIVVSGGLTESGAVREFDEASEFLTGLRTLLGLRAERCVIVPGSSDLTRLACKAHFDLCAADDVVPQPPYWPKWRHFSRAFTELYRDIDGVTFESSQPWTLYAVPDLRVVIAGLNSTIAETHRPQDCHGMLGEAQAAWFAEQLRPFAEQGWLRLAAVGHDPGVLRDSPATAQLLSGRVNLLLHGQSGRDLESPSGGPGPGDGRWPAPLLTIPADRTGEPELVQLTADGLTRWRAVNATGEPEPVRHVWQSAATTFPPGSWSQLSGDAPADLPSARQRPGDDARRVASPVEQLLDQITEVVEATRPNARIRRIESADGPPHLLITQFQEGFGHQRRVAAHVGEITQDVIEAFAAQVHSGEVQVDAELVCGGPRPERQLRSLALRRGIRLRTFTEFQGLLDLRDYVARQATRLQSDQRYPHALYVAQRYRDLEAPGAGVRENVVEDLLRQLAVDAGRFILILGDFGRGKTFALRELARQVPERLPHLIPIYVELRELDKAHSVDALVAAHLANHGEDVIDLKAFRYMLQQGRIVLLFDGFDELATRVTYDRAADHLQALVAAAEGKAKIVVASRTQHFRSQEQVFTALGERVGQLPSRLVLGIEDFTDDQVRSYLAHLYGEERAAEERLRLIGSIEDLPALSSNPRMLSFIAALDADRLRSVAGARGTLSAAGLYQVILDAWLSYEHERTHGIPGAPAGLSLEGLWQLVTALALRLNDSGETIIRLADLTDEVAASLAGLADGQLTAQQGAHAIGAGSLLVRVEDGVFGFIHSSVAEWLVAREIAAKLASPDGPVTTLETRPLSPLTIDFLYDLAAPAELREWVVGVLEGPGPGPAEAGPGGAARANALRLNARMRVPARSDLRGAQLRGEDLSNRQFGEVDFSGADLTGARLIGANLAGANLTEAKLVRTRLDFTQLPGATLRGADLTGARLTRADLTGVQLEGSRWNRAAVIDVTGLPPDARARPELHGAAIAPGMPVQTEVAPADIGVPFGYDEKTARLPQPLAYSPDGGLLAIGNSDGGVTLCDAETGLPVRTLRGHQDRVYSTRFARAGRVLVTAASDATLRRWDVATGECTVTPVPGTGAWPCQVSPDGELLAYGATDGVVRVLDVASGEIRHQLPGHAPLVYTAAFADDGDGSPRGRRLLTGDQAGVVRVWDLDSETLVMQFSLPGGTVYQLCATGVASARGGPLFAAAGSAGSLLLLDQQGPVTRLEGHAEAIYGLDMHPSRPLLATGDTKGEVRLWDLAASSQPTMLASHPDAEAVYGLTFSPDGSQLATAYLDGLVRITTVADGRVRHRLAAHRSAVWRPVFRPDGTQLATASIDGTCRLWDTATGQARNVVRGHGRRVSSVTFSADGGLLAAGGNDGVVRVWDPVTGRQRHVVTGEADRLVSAVFSPIGTLLAAASNDGGVYLLNAATGMRDREMNVGTERVWAETFSPDGTVLATANDDDSVRLWFRATGRNIRSITEHRGRVRSLSFSPDGTLLATGCDDKLVRVWDADTGALRARLPGHADRVYAVAFSPDGTLLASAGNDGAAYLWDPQAGSPVLRLEPPGGRLWTAAFSPAGDVLATAGDDGVIRLWSVPGGTLLRGLEGHAGRVAAIAFSPGVPGSAGPLLASASDDGTVRLWETAAEPALRVTLLGTSGGWAAFAADGRYKADGAMTGEFWHVIGSCRFEPGELDPYLPAITRLPADAPF